MDTQRLTINIYRFCSNDEWRENRLLVLVNIKLCRVYSDGVPCHHVETGMPYKDAVFSSRYVGA